MKKRALVSMIPVTACLAFAAPALAKTTATTQQESVSENWAGYEVTPSGTSKFSTVSGEWVQPKVTGSATDTSSDSFTGFSAGASGSDSGEYSAFWVGLGGGDTGAKALEQIGTQADVSATGKKTYYAWYELVPKAPVRIDLAIKPGDKIWAQTSVNGDEVSFKIDNETTGQDWAKTVDMTSTAPDTSTAEWVAEAPSECTGGATSDCTPLTLADFGKADFTDSSVTSTDGTTGSINNSDWSQEAIALEDEASAGTLSSDGTSFTVKYGADATDESESAGYGSDSGYGYSSGSTTSSTGGYAPGSVSSGGYGDSGYGYGDGYGYTSGYGDSGYGDSGYGYSSDGDASDYGYGIAVSNGDGGYTVYVYGGY